MCLILILFSALSAEARQAGADFRVPFTHRAQNESLAVLLAEFARTQGYESVVSPRLTGQVNGSFEQTGPQAFLQSMAAAYQVRWYLQRRTLVFYAAQEREKAFLAPSVVSARNLLGLLRNAGMLSPQLDIRLLRDRNMLVATGPGFYLDQLRQAMAALEQSYTRRQGVRVFHLKHAWAEDKTVAGSGGTSVTVPGVATILRAMVLGTPVQSRVTRVSSPQKGLLGQGLAATETPETAPEEKQTDLPGVNITADPRVNAVVVSDAEYRMEYYARVIRDLDRPVRLVEIHAAVVDIDSNFRRELGISYQGRADLGSGWSIGGSAGAQASSGVFPEAGAEAGSGLSMSTLYTHSTDFFLTRVRALEEDGVARMLGKPSVLTTDNVQATLENTSTYYVPVSGYQATDLFRIETGTVLQVTPHIIPGTVLSDGTKLPDAIKLIVSIQDNQDSNAQFSVQQTNLQPIKQTRINTQAIVNAGQSLLIAGYYREKQSDGSSGVPVLKNIPLLGRLFGSKDQEHTRVERLILITPRIISLDEAPLPPTRVDDPRFSRSPTQAGYEERLPQKPPVGGCTRRRLDYASSPDLPTGPGPEPRNVTR